MKFTPHPYQKRMIRWLLERPEAGLFSRPGSGKTVCVLRALTTLLKARAVDRALVLAPLSVVHTVWPEERKKWDFAQGLRMEILHGPRKTEALRRKADLYVMNYEGLSWLSKQRWQWPQMLVNDESVRLKSARTQRFALLREHLRDFHRRVILSGQPSPNGLMDLWSQLYALDLGKRLEPYIGRFRYQYFTEVGPHDWMPKPDAESRIAKVIGDICLYLDPSEYLQLPPLVHSRIPVQLPAKAAQVYASLEAAFFAQLDKGDVTAANAGVRSNKLRQVTGGAAYLDNTEHEWEEVHSAKVDALMGRLEDSGEPTLVAYEFNHERERIVEALDSAGYAWKRLAGTAKQRREAVQLWNNNELDVLLGHPGAMGHGVNLQAGGRRFIWFNPTWNYDHYDQAMARIHRQGQKHRVFVDTLVVEDSIEEAVLGALAQKGSSQARLFGALQNWRRKKA